MKLRPQATGLCLGVGAWWSMSWRGCQVVAQAARVMQTRRRTKRLRPSTNSCIRIAAGPNNGRTQRIAWVEQQASLRLPCQRAERHRALLVAHPVRNALRHTLCPTPQRCGEAACAWPPRLPRLENPRGHGREFRVDHGGCHLGEQCFRKPWGAHNCLRSIGTRRTARRLV